jgi:hypothetical protein
MNINTDDANHICSCVYCGISNRNKQEINKYKSAIRNKTYYDNLKSRISRFTCEICNKSVMNSKYSILQHSKTAYHLNILKIKNNNSNDTPNIINSIPLKTYSNKNIFNIEMVDDVKEEVILNIQQEDKPILHIKDDIKNKIEINNIDNENEIINNINNENEIINNINNENEIINNINNENEIINDIEIEKELLDNKKELLDNKKIENIDVLPVVINNIQEKQTITPVMKKKEKNIMKIVEKKEKTDNVENKKKITDVFEDKKKITDVFENEKKNILKKDFEKKDLKKKINENENVNIIALRKVLENIYKKNTSGKNDI